VARAGGNAGMQALLAADLKAYRTQIGVPTTNTVAVGRAQTGNPALDCLVFTGASPEVKNQAKPPQPQLDNDPVFRNRDIRSPTNARQDATRHAEEEVVNRFHNQAKALKLNPQSVTGTFYILQSNPRGVCGTCLQGVNNPNKEPGVLVKLSRMYPNLNIRVDTEQFDPATRANVRRSFTLRNGNYVEEK
jgi:toxin YxiD